ncbi:variable large family protein [Borrelia duttonii]|uniref:Variable large protein n=1 Tax=Borrelia duttonii (strain Ly) TaxID=412419 RepID=B5RP66_BORDL|nr:vlp protein, gamma subfamily [Borrelia duttonii Ly]ACH94243.1 vlp protein, gamma subfamily [Borrelia duttonii Ly]
MNKEKKGEGKVRVLILMVMMIVMMMGCNSGVVEAEQGKNKFLQSLVNVSNEFLNVFTSFGDMVGSVLGLSVESKKSDVGKYFKTVAGTVQGIKDGLNKIVSEMKEEKNPNAEATESSVKALVESKLDKIIEGAKTASEAIGVEGSELIGNVADQNAGAVGTEVDNIIKGIKNIVEVILKEGNSDAGDVKGPVKDADGSAGAARAAAGGADGDAGKLFASDNSGGAGDAAKAAKDAAKAVGAVTGADILKAISIGVGGNAAKLAKNTDAVANIAAAANAKDATIAGAIVLRAMAKNGKFSGPSDAAKVDVSAAVKGAAVSAVTKALDTLTMAIRKTIDLGLKNVKDAMKINSNAISVVSDKDASGAKNQ